MVFDGGIYTDRTRITSSSITRAMRSTTQMAGKLTLTSSQPGNNVPMPIKILIKRKDAKSISDPSLVTCIESDDENHDVEKPKFTCRYQKVFESIEPHARLVHRFVRTPGRHVRPL